MSVECANFTLPPVMKMDDCERLHAFLRDRLDQPVQLDCSSVTRLGGLAAQLIAMGAMTWAKTDNAFIVSDPSPGCRQSLASMGLSQLLTQEGSPT